MEFNKMPIIQTYYNIFQCLECGNNILLKDLYKNEIYCRSCGLIHDTYMLIEAKDKYKANNKNNDNSNDLFIIDKESEFYKQIEREFKKKYHNKKKKRKRK